MIVEDDLAMRRFLVRALRDRSSAQAEWTVVTAESPEEAQGLVNEAPADHALFVLADYDLRAAMTGADLIERIRGTRPEAILVLMSGHEQSVLAREIDRVAPNAFFQKGMDLSGFVDKVVPLIEFAALRRTARPPDLEAAGYRAFLDSIEDYAVFMLDPTGHVRTWNRGAELLLGYARSEVVGQHLSLFYRPEDVGERKPQFEIKVASDRGRFEDTGWRVRKDGSSFWANVVVTAIRSSTGELVGFSKVTRDVTAARTATEALRQSEERYRLLIQSVKDYAIYMLDPFGRIVSWNEGAQRLKGYSADEVIGEHFSKFYTPADRARGHPEEELAQALSEGRYEEEGWRVHKDGSLFWANVVITPLYGPDQSHRGFAKVTRDLTQRRELEQGMHQRTVELTEIARELEAFNYTVAHDLRGPLRAILHLTGTLLDEASLPEAERRGILRSLNESARRMGHLVDDLLALSRASKGELVRESIDLAAIARSVFAELCARSGATKAELRAPRTLVVDADPRLMRIVIENLFSNALKFSRKMSQPLVELGEIKTGAGLAYYVRDNGVGFDETRVGELFRPFHRLHRESEFEGTGIGLATVARVVSRHGGRVWAESGAGRGATFYFTLAPGLTRSESRTRVPN